ncbi:hypothetical protein FQR65_LT19250 [Abscondita terminalis]|nr:hypothetical protein FQR65_LT19250 [Abscondita terminalis]
MPDRHDSDSVSLNEARNYTNEGASTSSLVPASKNVSMSHEAFTSKRILTLPMSDSDDSNESRSPFLISEENQIASTSSSFPM